MEYKVNQRLTKEDYIAFVTNHIIISFFKWTNILLFSISIGYLVLTPFLTGSFTFFFIGLGIMLLIVAGIVYVRYNAKKTFDKNPDSFAMTYIMNDEGFKLVMEEGERLIPWSDFYRVKETDDYMYLYLNAQQGLVLVKRSTRDEIIEFVIRQLKEHMTEQKRLKLLKK